MSKPVEMGPAARATWDALVEEHLAVQQMMREAMEAGEPSEQAYARMSEAFATAAELLKANTVEAPDDEC